MLLARDHFGIKPLYYCSSDKFLAFASEIKALLTLPQISSEINEEKIADFLLFQDDGCSTGYKGVYKILPGHYLIHQNEKLKECQYWKLEPCPTLKLKDNREYIESFKEVLAEAVDCRMRRIEPIGSHLSGGLDSSSITCVARDLLRKQGRNEQLHTFSYFFDRLQHCDERKS